MARTGRVSDFMADQWLALLMAQATHLSLMTQDPYSVADPLTVEPQSGVYSRAPVAWARSGRLLNNSGILVWTGVPAGISVVSIAGFDAAFNGNMLFSGPTPVMTFTAQGSVEIPINSFFVGLDS